MTKIDIEVFGGLKQFFPKQFQLDKIEGDTIGDVISKLEKQQPEAQSLLKQCLVAAENEIYSKEILIERFSSLVIMPPFSGG